MRNLSKNKIKVIKNNKNPEEYLSIQKKILPLEGPIGLSQNHKSLKRL